MWIYRGNLLNWGKSQIKGIVINQINFNVNDIFSEVLQLISIVAGDKQIAIKNNIDPDTIVHADINHFKFIIRNLLSNAVKYSRNNGQIVVNAKKSDDSSQIIFSIKDDGVGIRNDKKLEIFESFGISTPGTANEKGNGIGLRLCKEFVVENGGKIWVESEKDKGAIFYFSLKAHE